MVLETVPFNFLPGPVSVTREVRAAFEKPPQSHRRDAFIESFRSLKESLCELACAGQVEILLGSGTLANDVVAAQLSLETRPGIVLVGGEFGERLADHAKRFKLKFDAVQIPRDRGVGFAVLTRALGLRRPAWLWCAHCETSTGALADLDAMKSVCAARGIKLCLDCVGSIGTAPLNLEGVFLASASSGKGLRSFPGLGLVFYNHLVAACPEGLPRCLDLGYYAENQGVPFSQSSNHIHALSASMNGVDWNDRFAKLADESQWLRAELRRLGFQLICDENSASPAVTTAAFPTGLDSFEMGRALERDGFWVSYKSSYLRRENWMQICLMSEFHRNQMMSLVERLEEFCAARRAA